MKLHIIIVNILAPSKDITFEAVPLVEFMYLVHACTSVPVESYRRRLGCLLLYLCDVIRALINSLEL